jgi:hypothetical protein
VTEILDPVDLRLLEVLEGTARGPRQNAVFAVWMVVRLCAGLLPPEPLSPGVRRRRLAGAERRLGSLTLPGPIRRGLASALRELSGGTAGAVAVALQQLVAPAREALGSEVAEALAAGAREVRELGRRVPTAAIG